MMRLKWMLIAFLPVIAISVQIVTFADEANPEAKVMEVVDGDTIIVSYGGDTVKCVYIGVSAPESENPLSSEARQFNKDLLEEKTARLEFDERRRDEYGNLLAYVHCGDVFVNAELLKRGYASVMIISPNTKHGEDFLKLEREAREAGRGMWAEPGKTDVPFRSVHSLEEQIARMKEKIEELISKIDELFRIIEELQSQPADAPPSVQRPESDKTDKQVNIDSPEQDQSGQIVSVTKSGTKYHKPDCGHLKGRQYSEISVKEAERKGLQPCSDCFHK